MAQKKQTSHIDSSTFVKPSVVAVMGHVDHGKTTLLDYIRKSRVALGEFGSITQHIGAYQVPVGSKKITFIDTPGHEAFANLRSRGASVADIALLVIDAKESVKPQTVESIKIIQKEKIPMIVVLTKMDIVGANPDKVKKDLLQQNVIVEEHGGSIANVAVSAKTGEGIDDLLGAILLVAELKNITADPNAPLSAVVIEAKKDPGRGNVATIIVQQGTLRVRDEIRVEQETFPVRALVDEYRKGIDQALPGRPVEILGFTSLPTVGSLVTSKDSTSVQAPSEMSVKPVLDKNSDAILKLFLKADASGSLEAILHGLPKEVSVSQTGIGEITESDIAQAKTMDLVVIGFNVKVPSRVTKLAKDEAVRIRTYTLIYKLFEEIEEVVTLLAQGPQREIIGQAKILKTFETSDGEVAGCQVMEGRIAKGDKVIITRGNKEIAEGLRIKSLREQKEEVTKVKKGDMCGLLLTAPVDFKPGDMIQSYTLYEF